MHSHTHTCSKISGYCLKVLLLISQLRTSTRPLLKSHLLLGLQWKYYLLFSGFWYLCSLNLSFIGIMSSFLIFLPHHLEILSLKLLFHLKHAHSCSLVSDGRTMGIIARCWVWYCKYQRPEAAICLLVTCAIKHDYVIVLEPDICYLSFEKCFIKCQSHLKFFHWSVIFFLDLFFLSYLKWVRIFVPFFPMCSIIWLYCWIK